MKNLLLLSLIVAAIYWYYKPTGIIVPAGAGRGEIELNADSILRICEMSGASQEIEVIFDTTWTEQRPDLVFLGYVLAHKNINQRLKESRVFVVKAGTPSVQVRKNKIIIERCEILSVAEKSDKYRLHVNTADTWNVVAVNKYVERSKRMAIKKSLDAGILSTAENSILETLGAVVPVGVEVEIR